MIYNLGMNKLGIIIDSFAGVSKDELLKKDIHLLCQKLILDGDVYKDGETITVDEYISRLEKIVDTKTSMPSIGEVQEMFEMMSKKYEQVIFLPMNQGLSSTFSVGFTAASEFTNIHVLNTKFSGHQFIEIALEARKKYEKGQTINQVIEYIRDVNENTFCNIIPNNVEAMVKGGRLKGAAKVVMVKGKLIPRLQLDDDGVSVKGVKRSVRRTIQTAINRAKAKFGDEIITEWEWEALWGGDTASKKIIEEVYKENGIKFKTHLSSAAVISYTGHDAVGVVAYKKNIKN